MKKIGKLLTLIVLMIIVTGCFKRDDLEDVDIYTTVYPIEYVADYLYGYNANIKSIYPAETDITKYKLTKKQLKEYAMGSIFIYNGLSNEKSIARDMLNTNNDLRIIDVSQGLEFDFDAVELWLNPSDFLMLAHNIKNGLDGYIGNKYIAEEIDKNYEELKVIISGFDAELQMISSTSKDNFILIASDELSFLSKYNLNVVSIDDKTKSPSSMTISKAKRLIESGTIKYIYMLDTDKKSALVRELENLGAKTKVIRTMTVKNEEDIANNMNYKTIMRDNVDNIKQEFFE